MAGYLQMTYAAAAATAAQTDMIALRRTNTGKEELMSWVFTLLIALTSELSIWIEVHIGLHYVYKQCGLTDEPKIVNYFCTKEWKMLKSLIT